MTGDAPAATVGAPAAATPGVVLGLTVSGAHGRRASAAPPPVAVFTGDPTS